MNRIKLVVDDYIGNKYNMITVIGDAGQDENNKTLVFTKCDCGKEPPPMRLSCLKGGDRFSCGCKRRTSGDSRTVTRKSTRKNRYKKPVIKSNAVFYQIPYLEWLRLGAGSKSKTDPPRSSLTYEFLENLLYEQRGRCAVTGLPLHWPLPGHPMNYSEYADWVVEQDTNTGYMVSIDRIDCSKGYSEDNVHLTCRFFNMGRNSTPIEEAHRLIRHIKEGD